MPTHPKAFANRHNEVIRGVTFTLAIFAVSRAVATITIYAGTRIMETKNMHQAFLAWDSNWYYRIITEGYPHVAFDESINSGQSTVAFFPLYPLVSRLVHNITTLSPFVSGVIVSILFGATATVLLWVFARDLTNVSVANKTIALFCFFPGSLAMLTLMSDGAMLTFAIGCLLSLHRKNWLLAGACAALATASRPNAGVLILCCLWAACEAIARNREWRSLAAPALAPLGILAFFAFLWKRTGDTFAWYHSERAGWHGENEGGLFVFLRQLHDPLINLDGATALVAFVTALLGFIFLSRWKPPAILSIYAVGICLLAFAVGETGSKVRYLWTAFPLAIATALWARTELRFYSFLAIGASLFPIYILAALFADATIT